LVNQNISAFFTLGNPPFDFEVIFNHLNGLGVSIILHTWEVFRAFWLFYYFYQVYCPNYYCNIENSSRYP